MNNITPQSAKELNQILSFLSQSSFEKIPKNILEYLNEIEDSNYITKINSIQDINENNIMEETKNNLAYIFFNYLANEDEQKEYKILLKYNEERYQKEISEKYDISNIFEKRKNNYNENISNEISLIVKKDKNIFEIIIEKIKNLFNK